ncbi:hypothetical protein JZ751_009038 [Albula glossodonta]|uniref:Solute carrier family 13 member 1 n=1 Tax=Albula glossodonta TaxID=121402 RepID=A0A8T2P8E7_9TELE|nr:hypothetical protein JZ751_009038 [Albula glossodonta]
MRVLREAWRYRSLIIIILTPLLLLPLPLLIGTKVSECAFTLLVMAVFWLTEALPLGVTALLPALLFPLFGILKSTQVAAAYFKDFHLLLTGVICLATSIEKWNLHKRIALRLVILVGVNPGWLMLGFMVSSAFLSMWLSNTSTAAMVMPIVEAVIQQIMRAESEVTTQRERSLTGCSNTELELEGEGLGLGASNLHATTCPPGVDNSYSVRIHYKGPVRVGVGVPAAEPKGQYRSVKDHMMCKGLSLCIAYSSTIGGITTLPGTSTNLIFNEQINDIIILLLSWIWLHWMFLGTERERSDREKATARVIEQEYNDLGPVSFQETATLVIFIVMVLLWLVRDPGFMPGWASLFPQLIPLLCQAPPSPQHAPPISSYTSLCPSHPTLPHQDHSYKCIHDAFPLAVHRYSGYATDATVALLLGLMFFIIPANKPSSPKYAETLITWTEFQSCMPWEICLLVGGGFALAEGTKVSGLSVWVGNLLTPLGSLPIWALITITCVIVTTFTEVASNPATITIFLPILAPLVG